MGKYSYTCPSCGTRVELRKRVVVSNRWCNHCGAPILTEEIDRQKKQATLYGCAGLALFVLFCCVLPGFFSEKKPAQPAADPVSVEAPAVAPSPRLASEASPQTPRMAAPPQPLEAPPSVQAVGAAGPPAPPPMVHLEADEADDPKIPTVQGRIAGKVISVTDGDTLKLLLRDHDQLTIRLEGIDAPEAKQQHGARSKDALAKLTLGKEVTLAKTGVDKYGRTLRVVLLEGNDVNLRMLEDGWAWHSTKYNSETRYANAERRAKAARLGLWAGENIIPPWEYRDRQRLLPPTVTVQAPRPPPEEKTKEQISVRPPVREVQPAPVAPVAPTIPQMPAGRFWLNTTTGVRHNAGCQHYANTKRGRFCGPNEGRGCGICGG